MNYADFLSLDAPLSQYANARYILVPVPYDGTSTWGKGAEKGPAALLAASDQLEEMDVETGIEACTRGIHVDRQGFDFGSGAAAVEQMVEEVRKRVGSHLEKDKVPIVLGGEHSVAIGAIQAVAQKWPDLIVLQIDAHSDLRQEYHGSRFNHACVMARARECARILQVGIRSTAREELESIDRQRIWYDHEIHDNLDWIEGLLTRIDAPVYISFDLDGFDPAVLPSTGTPQPGGLSWREATTLLRRVYDSGRVVAWDINELCPDGNRVSDFTAAKLLYKMIGYHAKNEALSE